MVATRAQRGKDTVSDPPPAMRAPARRGRKAAVSQAEPEAESEQGTKSRATRNPVTSRLKSKPKLEPEIKSAKPEPRRTRKGASSESEPHPEFEVQAEAAPKRTRKAAPPEAMCEPHRESQPLIVATRRTRRAAAAEPVSEVVREVESERPKVRRRQKPRTTDHEEEGKEQNEELEVHMSMADAKPKLETGRKRKAEPIDERTVMEQLPQEKALKKSKKSSTQEPVQEPDEEPAKSLAQTTRSGTTRIKITTASQRAEATANIRTRRTRSATESASIGPKEKIETSALGKDSKNIVRKDGADESDLLRASARKPSVTSTLKVAPKHVQLSPSESKENDYVIKGVLLQASARKPPVAQSPLKLPPVSTSQPNIEAFSKSSLFHASARKPPIAASPLKLPPASPSKWMTEAFGRSLLMQNSARKPVAAGSPLKAPPFSVSKPMEDAGLKTSLLQGSARKPPVSAMIGSITASPAHQQAPASPIKASPLKPPTFSLMRSFGAPTVEQKLPSSSVDVRSPFKMAFQTPTKIGSMIFGAGAVMPPDPFIAESPQVTTPPWPQQDATKVMDHVDGSIVGAESSEGETPLRTEDFAYTAIEERSTSLTGPSQEPKGPSLLFDEGSAQELAEEVSACEQELAHQLSVETSINAGASAQEKMQWGSSKDNVAQPSTEVQSAIEVVPPNSPMMHGSFLIEGPTENTLPALNFSLDAPLVAPARSPNKSSLKSPGKNRDNQSPKKSVSWRVTMTPEAKSDVEMFINDGPLRSCIVYVDVTSNGKDMSQLFIPVLEDLGAEVVVQWKSNEMPLTHVVFKDGEQMTLAKAVATNREVKCVNIGWVLDCEKNNEHVREDNYLINLAQVPGNTSTPRMALSAHPTPLTARKLLQTPSKRTASPLDREVYDKDINGSDKDTSKNASFDDKENMMPMVTTNSPGTPYYLHPDKLIQKTCPPKKTHESAFGMGGNVALTPFKQRLLAAKRRSAEFAPKTSSPLKRFKTAF